MIANANRSDNEAPDSEAPDSVVPDSVVPDNIVPANVPANMPAKVVPAEAVPARGAPVRVEFMSVVPCPKLVVKELKGILQKGDSGNIVVVEPRKVDIGGGVMVDGMQLDQLLSHQRNTPSKFARRLIRMLFTNEELLGKSLFGKGCNRFRATIVEQKPALDPVRLNAVLAFTCKTFNTTPQQLKSSLSSMLVLKAFPELMLLKAKIKFLKQNQESSWWERHS
ncbi:hypothetical protein V5799_021274 [Amblyomma americanum]|uniref:BEN domain-containing protein n=1 Tax=Amblyomma americanum TaxID=6943 RepID=A0AAQ4FP08_AMBAM